MAGILRVLAAVPARIETWAFVAWLLVLTSAMVLGAVRVRSTELSLVATSTLASMRFSHETALNAMTVSRLSVLGVKELRALGDASPLQSFGEPVDLSFDGGGSVSLSHTTLPMRARLRLDRVDSAGRYRAFVSGPPVTIRVGVPPGGTMAISGRPPVKVAGLAPRAFDITGDAPGLEFLFTLNDPDLVMLTASGIEELHMWTAERDESSATDRLSGLIAGQVSFLSAPAAPLPLHRGDDIDIVLEEALLHSLVLTSNGVDLNLSGRATDLKTRVGFSRVSKLPTWFEYLAAMPVVRAVVALLTFLVALGLHRRLTKDSHEA